MPAFDALHYWIEARFERRDGWDDDVYPFNLPVLRGLETLRLHPKVTYFVGENGSGKSTLVEALAVAWGFNPEGGTKNFSFGTKDSHSPLHRFVRPVRSARHARDGFFLRAESFFNAASYLDDLAREAPGTLSSYGGRSLHAQSHGESFFALFDNRFGGHGLYILDEPEAALSPQRQLAFLARMHELIGANSQFIIATHSPIILGYPDALIYQASRFGLEEIAYEDAEAVSVTKGFLNHRERSLSVLLADEDEGEAEP